MTIPSLIEAYFGAIIRTPTITDAACDAASEICVTRAVDLGDTAFLAAGYDTAMYALQSIAENLGLSSGL